MKSIQKRWLVFIRRLRTHVMRIHVREDPEQVIQSIIKKRLRTVLFLLILAILAFVYCYLQPAKPSALTGNQLRRGTSDEEITLTVQGEDELGTIQKDIVFQVDSKKLTAEEKLVLTEKVGEYLQQKIKGKNESLNCVSYNLNFIQIIPDTDIELEWIIDDMYLSESGELIKEAIPKEGIETDVEVTATWKNWKEVYHFPVFLKSPQYSRDELFEKEVTDAVQKRLGEEDKKEVVTLPRQINGKAISYKTEDNGKSFSLLYIVLAMLLLVPLFWYRQEKREEEKREEQLLFDHPRVVNQFMLLLGAGLTVRKVVERLTLEYERTREKGGEKRYVYEEMCVMLREMRDGISEAIALEHFGKRCHLLPYLRFTSVLTQNMKKGAEGILLILEKESMEALEQRKQRILQLGEKAGTKLLFPMMVMLGLVMAIIMVPAFMTM